MRISPVAAIRPLVAFIIVLVVVCGPSVAFAGWLLSTPYAYDDDLGPGIGGAWQGVVPYGRVAPIGTNAVTANVEYAVFLPGQFQLFLNDNLGGPPPFDPAPNEVIYAYQVLDVTAASPGINTVTVGLDNFDIPGTVSPPSYVSTGLVGEEIPGGSAYNTTSMVWSFANNSGTPANERIEVGEFSPILIFSSLYLPELDNLTVSSGLAGTPAAFNSVPSIGELPVPPGGEIPEPSSFLLLLLGGVGLLRQFRSRR